MQVVSRLSPWGTQSWIWLHIDYVGVLQISFQYLNLEIYTLDRIA